MTTETDQKNSDAAPPTKETVAAKNDQKRREMEGKTFQSTTGTEKHG